MSAVGWIGFATATLAATGSPGPNALLIIRNTSRYGVSSAALTMLGNVMGRIAMACGIVLGLSALLGSMPQVLVALRAAGALCLIYFGIKAFIVRRRTHVMPPSRDHLRRSNAMLFLEASAVSVGNPNTLGFFAAVIPQFVDVRAALMPQLSTLLAIDSMIVMLVMSTYAVATHFLRRRSFTQNRLQLIKRCGGAMLIVVGVSMLPLR